MIYTVTFNPAIDYVMRADSVVLGNTNRSRSEELYFGGKGIKEKDTLYCEAYDHHALFTAGSKAENHKHTKHKCNNSFCHFQHLNQLFILFLKAGNDFLKAALLTVTKIKNTVNAHL